MIALWRHRRQLSFADVRLISVVVAVQIVLGLALRVVAVLPLRRAVARYRAVVQRAMTAPEARVAWAVEAVGRRLPHISTCFVRALAADLLLTRANDTTQIRIGVRRAQSGSLESHAWFERNGRIVVGGAGAKDYVPFVTLEDSAADRGSWTTTIPSTGSR